VANWLKQKHTHRVEPSHFGQPGLIEGKCGQTDPVSKNNHDGLGLGTALEFDFTEASAPFLC